MLHLDRLQSLPQRILPFADSEVSKKRAAILHPASCTGFETRGNGTRFYWRNDDRLEGFYLLKITIDGLGYLEDRDAGVTHELPTGYAFLIPMSSNTSYYCDTEGSWTFLWVNFVGPTTRRVCAEICRCHGYVFDLRRFPRVLEAMLSLYQHRLENQRHNPYFVSEIVYRILMSLLQVHESIAPQVPASINDACEHMQASLGDSSLSIEQIANSSGYSKFHFTRKFKKHMRVSPHQYLVRLRLERAVELITTTDLPVKIISNRVGFKEVTHFYNVFKKYMHLTPGSLNRPPH